MSQSVPAALTIAGSDCSSGAGIQADLKTFQHFHVHGLTAVTCVVAETARTVQSIHPVPVEILRDQITLLLDSFPLTAVKTGMLFSAAHVETVAAILSKHPGLKLVVDPVMVASSGSSLLAPEAIDSYRKYLLPLAYVVTPNLPEAEVLLGRPIHGESGLEPAAKELAHQLGTSVLLKGGHLNGPDCIDVLVENHDVFRFVQRRVACNASHGTGCTFSAAVTAALAHGEGLAWAVERAKKFLGRTLIESYAFESTRGGSIGALNQGTLFQAPPPESSSTSHLS